MSRVTGIYDFDAIRGRLEELRKQEEANKGKVSEVGVTIPDSAVPEDMPRNPGVYYECGD